MEQAEISRRVQDHFGARIVEAGATRDQHWVTVKPGDLVAVLTWLRDTPELGFDFLMDVGGVDYQGHPADKEWRYEIAYQLSSLKLNHRFRVKVAVESEKVAVPTVRDLWMTANWMEREVYDQFGIPFSGHGNLRRILNHEDFQGHPLRKDYPINRRQKCSRPIEHLLPDDPEWA